MKKKAMCVNVILKLIIRKTKYFLQCLTKKLNFVQSFSLDL